MRRAIIIAALLALLAAVPAQGQVIRVFTSSGGGTAFTGGTLTSDLLFSADNTLDIGASGATRPRTGYFGTSVISPVLDSGAATNLLLKYNGTTYLTVGSNLLTLSANATYGAGSSQMYGFRKQVVARTSNGSETATNYQSVFTNEGATAKPERTLPGAGTGSFTFIVQDADGLRIVAAAGDTIQMGPKVTAAAGYIESTTIGSVVTLQGINGTEWVATSWHGTWTDGTWTASDAASYTP